MMARILQVLNVAIYAAVFACAAYLHHLGLVWWLAVSAALCLWLVVHAAVVSFGFVLSRIWFSPIPGHLDNPVALPLAYVSEMLVSCWAYYYAMCWRSDWAAPLASKSEQHRPVLLVHGFGCNRGVWLRLQAQLQQRGHGVHAINLEPPLGSIRDYAKPLRQAIDQLSQANGGRDVLVVAHSMGGLAMRSCVKATGLAGIAHIITLGTPHAGTVIARLALGANGQQMRRHSTDRDELSSLFISRLTTVMSYHDNIVFPQETALVEGATKVQLVGCAHLDLCTDARVFDLIFKQLEK